MVDLGTAPGGWTQIALDRVGHGAGAGQREGGVAHLGVRHSALGHVGIDQGRLQAGQHLGTFHRDLQPGLRPQQEAAAAADEQD